MRVGDIVRIDCWGGDDQKDTWGYVSKIAGDDTHITFVLGDAEFLTNWGPQCEFLAEEDAFVVVKNPPDRVLVAVTKHQLLGGA